jgi:C4-dicarboxylate transporter, DctM subunit
MLFASISGSSPATVIAVGSIAIAGLVRNGYSLKYATGVVINAGTLGILLPPSIVMAVLTSQQIPQALTEAMARGNVQPWIFLLSINVAMLIAGNFMEPTSIVLIFAPIIFPIAMRLGINPIHLGVLMTVNMEIGLVHPPVALNLFVAAGVTPQSLWDVTKAALPWLAILVAFLILITYVPILSTWLPDLAFGKDQFLNDQ